MATILVSGGAGFLGSALVRQLVAQGHGVRVLDNLSNSRAENLDGLTTELRVGDAVSPALEGVEREYHLACLDHPTVPTTVYGASKLAGESYVRAFVATGRAIAACCCRCIPR